MLSAIREQPDYAQHKSTVRQVLGDTDTNRRIMDTLETISNSLGERYELLYPPTPPSSSPSPSSSQQKTPLQIASNANIIAAISSPGTEPIGDGKSMTYAQLSVISCEALFQRMQKKSVLVMDCRSTADYENSHLTYYCAFNVPEEIITPG